MAQNLVRDWFMVEDGIRREVISAYIQEYLGNDATVRPGKQKSEDGTEVWTCLTESTSNICADSLLDQRVLDQGIPKLYHGRMA